MPDNHPEPNSNDINDSDIKKYKITSFIAGFVLGVLLTFLVGLGSCLAIIAG